MKFPIVQSIKFLYIFVFHLHRYSEYLTSTATVVEAPPARADLRSILQNGTDGEADTLGVEEL